MEVKDTSCKFSLSNTNKKDILLLAIDIIVAVVLMVMYAMYGFEKLQTQDLIAIGKNGKVIINILSVVIWGTFSIILGRKLSIEEDNYKSVASLISSSARRERELAKLDSGEVKNIKRNDIINKVVTFIQLVVMLLASITMSMLFRYNLIPIIITVMLIVTIICYIIGLKIKSRTIFDISYSLFTIILFALLLAS